MKKTFKKLLCSLLSLVLIGSMLVACSNVEINSNLFDETSSNGVSVMESKTTTPNKLEYTYKKFNGTKKIKIKVKEDSEEIALKVSTSSGKLEVTLDNDSSTVYEDTFEKSDNKTKLLNLDKGTYTLTVKATNHKGGFSLLKK